VNEQLDVMDADLSGLQSVWDSGMEDAYVFYRPRTTPRVALAAALVEGAVALQRLGGPAPDPLHLLLGDLCLARASRLLADLGDQRMQVGFARAVEQVSAAASGGPDVPSLRDLLLSTMEGRL
jgi:hypothetical protein